MPNNVIDILCTRPLSDEIILKALTENVKITTESFIETNAIVSKEVIDTIESISKESCVVIFTSMNAVEMVASHIPGIIDWKIYCVGNTTKEIIRESFGNHVIHGVGRDAIEVADLMINDKISSAYFFCGDIRRPEMPEKLRSQGIVLNEIEVYKTVETPKKINNSFSGILFFSPSAVRSFFKLNAVKNESVLFAIGSTTAEEIRKYSGNKIIISDSSDKISLVNKMIAHFSNS